MLAIINFKTYPQGTGRNAVKLAKQIESVSRRFKIRVILAVQAADINAVSSAVKIPVIAQHIDPIEYGSHTGSTLLQAIMANGAKGSLINHSERRISSKDIKQNIALLKKKRIMSVLCVKNVAEAKKYARFKPDYIAVEPPKLIGGKISVSKAKPALISNAVRAIKLPVLVGAGIHCTEDVSRAIELGAKGILVASNVLKAKNPKNALAELLKGF
jgi:triosephosphate isomerase